MKKVTILPHLTVPVLKCRVNQQNGLSIIIIEVETIYLSMCVNLQTYADFFTFVNEDRIRICTFIYREPFTEYLPMRMKLQTYADFFKFGNSRIGSGSITDFDYRISVVQIHMLRRYRYKNFLLFLVIFYAAMKSVIEDSSIVL
jgi:hypothetical protein